jgi:1-acyl-sn-glycerol-3-phosphate acyltransferase
MDEIEFEHKHKKDFSSVSLRLCGENDFEINENRKLTFPVEESNKSRLAGKIRYWWCWAVASVLLLFVAAPALLFLWIINRRLWLYPLAIWGAKTWLRACGARVEVTGLENLKDDEQYVFISNHRSYLDTATLFRYTGKRMGIVAKKELLRVPILGQGMHFVNVIAIDRSNPELARQSMEKARQVMEDGFSFGVFAEGTRAMPGELLPFKKGAVHLALQTGRPVVPVAIKNSDRLMGKRTGVAYPGTIEMVLLPPIDVGDYSESEIIELLNRTRTAIAEELGKKTQKPAR